MQFLPPGTPAEAARSRAVDPLLHHLPGKDRAGASVVGGSLGFVSPRSPNLVRVCLLGMIVDRGYNQAEPIARPRDRRLHLKQGAYLTVRTKSRPARLVLSGREHSDSVRGAYATRKGLRVDNLRVLLVDDVMMTGATLDSRAQALKSAGANAVLGWTIAPVVTGWSPWGPPPLRAARTDQTNQQNAASIHRR